MQGQSSAIKSPLAAIINSSSYFIPLIAHYSIKQNVCKVVLN